MKHYCYYSGGILREQENSKAIAKKLLRGEIADNELILDMETGLWVPVAKQRDIVDIYRHMRSVTLKKSLWEEYISETTTEEEGDVVDTLTPNRVILGFIPLWSWKQIFFRQYIVFSFFSKIVRSFVRWRYGKQDLR